MRKEILSEEELNILLGIFKPAYPTLLKANLECGGYWVISTANMTVKKDEEGNMCAFIEE